VYLQLDEVVLPVVMATRTIGRRVRGGCARDMVRRVAISAVRRPLVQTKLDRSVWRDNLTCLECAIQARIPQSS
jgi:hypothetical protein